MQNSCHGLSGSLSDSKSFSRKLDFTKGLVLIAPRTAAKQTMAAKMVSKSAEVASRRKPTRALSS